MRLFFFLLKSSKHCVHVVKKVFFSSSFFRNLRKALKKRVFFFLKTKWSIFVVKLDWNSYTGSSLFRKVTFQNHLKRIQYSTHYHIKQSKLTTTMTTQSTPSTYTKILCFVGIVLSSYALYVEHKTLWKRVFYVLKKSDMFNFFAHWRLYW